MCRSILSIALTMTRKWVRITRAYCNEGCIWGTHNSSHKAVGRFAEQCLGVIRLVFSQSPHRWRWARDLHQPSKCVITTHCQLSHGRRNFSTVHYNITGKNMIWRAVFQLGANENSVSALYQLHFAALFALQHPCHYCNLLWWCAPDIEIFLHNQVQHHLV